MKKKIFGITLAVCLIVLSIASTTMAYFTDTDDETNVFTAGNVKIDLNDNVLGIYQDGESVNVYPGMKISEGAVVTNMGSEEAYVGIIITFNKQLTDNQVNDVKELFGLAASTTYRYDGEKTNIYIISGDKLLKNAFVEFFEEVIIPTEWNSDKTAVFNATITVTAYATQTYGFTDAKTALKTAFPDANAWGTIA